MRQAFPCISLLLSSRAATPTTACLDMLHSATSNNRTPHQHTLRSMCALIAARSGPTELSDRSGGSKKITPLALLFPGQPIQPSSARALLLRHATSFCCCCCKAPAPAPEHIGAETPTRPTQLAASFGSYPTSLTPSPQPLVRKKLCSLRPLALALGNREYTWVIR